MGKLREVAKSIVRGLDDLNNRATAVDQISHSYTELQIEIVLEHLRILTQPIQKPQESAIICIPLVSGEDYGVTQDDIEEWAAAYPAVDVLQQLRNMRQWCLSNPRKKKTARGIRRFITGWLERKQNRGGDPQVSSKPIDDRPVFWPEA